MNDDELKELKKEVFKRIDEKIDEEYKRLYNSKEFAEFWENMPDKFKVRFKKEGYARKLISGKFGNGKDIGVYHLNGFIFKTEGEIRDKIMDEIMDEMNIDFRQYHPYYNNKIGK